MSPSLCILLLLSAAAAVHAAESNAMPAPMFADWLSRQMSSKARSASYEEVKTESVCLQETKLRNCVCLNTEDAVCNREYSESTLACCDTQGPGSFMAEKALLSVCNWQEDFFDDEVKYDGTSTTKIGTFTVTCEMREDAEKCGSPLCEGMNVIASGDILKYPRVAFVGYSEPEALPIDLDCAAINLREASRSGKSASREMPARIQYNYEGQEAAPKYWLANGIIYSGTFRVTSRFHATKYKAGQIQMAYPLLTDGAEAPTPKDTLPDKAYVAKANQVHLEFIKTEGY